MTKLQNVALGLVCLALLSFALMPFIVNCFGFDTISERKAAYLCGLVLSLLLEIIALIIVFKDEVTPLRNFLDWCKKVTRIVQ